MSIVESKWINQIKGLEHIEGYKIYSDGTILSFLKRHDYIYIVSDKPRKVLIPFSAGRRYDVVSLKGKDYPVHRLVAMAFIPNPDRKPQVHHKDGNKFNNDVSNLEWVTNSENQAYSVNAGTHVSIKGDNHYRRKPGYIQHNRKPVYQLDLNGTVLRRFDSVKEAAEMVNINYTTISKALTHPSCTAAGYKWTYA